VVPVPRGKIIGGSSSINYCFAMRARPSDHDAWVAAGNPGWSYDEVLPYYRAMESYAHGDARWHGRDGEYRVDPGDWNRGARDLFVVDASVLHTIPRVPINPTTIVLAEKFAAELLEALLPWEK
jgi:choline dehydrogenase-like flavoprotein